MQGQARVSLRPYLRRTGGIVVCIAGILVLTVFLLWRQEPMIDGRTVTEWAFIHSGFRQVSPSVQVKAPDVLKRSGRASVLRLADLLQARDSAWKRKYVLWARKHSWIPFHLLTAEEKHCAALNALAMVGTNLAPALPALTKFPSATNRSEQGAFAQLLNSIIRPSGDYHLASGWAWYPHADGAIIEIHPSGNEQYYICELYQPGMDVPGTSYFSMALLNTNGVMLDWIHLRRSTRGGQFLFRILDNPNGEHLVGSAPDRFGWAVQSYFSGSKTSFSYGSALLRIIVTNDEFQVFVEAEK